MRGLGPPHHVVDAHPLESPLVELGEACFQEPLHGLAALRAQFAVLGGDAATQRGPPGPAAGRPRLRRGRAMFGWPARPPPHPARTPRARTSAARHRAAASRLMIGD